MTLSEISSYDNLEGPKTEPNNVPGLQTWNFIDKCRVFRMYYRLSILFVSHCRTFVELEIEPGLQI